MMGWVDVGRHYWERASEFTYIKRLIYDSFSLQTKTILLRSSTDMTMAERKNHVASSRFDWTSWQSSLLYMKSQKKQVSQR